MSIRASNWAWSQDLPRTQKVMLLALADQADDAGVCWPSIKTLARKACVDVRTAQRNIRALERAKLVSVAARRRPDGDATSNLYRLALTLNPPRQNATAPVAPEPAGVVTLVPPQEPSYISINRAAASRAREPAAGAAAAEPRKATKTSTFLHLRDDGIICWIKPDQGQDDRPVAERIEANSTLEERLAAVAAVKKAGKSPVPGTVWAEILRRRAELKRIEQTKAREATGPLAEARQKKAARDLREADPARREAGLNAMRRAAKDVGVA